MRKWIAQLLLILFFVFSVFAGGSKEADERILEKQESWQEDFSISEKKAGKYNFVITVEDQGGNITVAGPYNIYIDPDSDLPVTGITNPSQNMQVPGNLNIVGTCIDDDAVSYVELILDGDTEHPVRAEGKEFWSYFLDTTQLYEGKHSIVAYGVDINGVIGNSVKTEWNLDRHQPVTSVNNMDLGILVTGKVNFSGTISDGNGIQELYYYLNDETDIQPLKVSYNRKEDVYSFSLSVDTRKLSDGPQVCWFKAVDKLGTEGVSSFLFFVDNSKPDIHLYSPAEGESINGTFTVAGSAYDAIGLESLTWQLGNETGEFVLTDGNPYWVKDFNILGQTARRQDLTITATDKAGNVATFKRRFDVDLEADLPVVTIQSPEYDGSKTGPTIGDELYLRGSVTDDDGAAELHWFIDKGGEEHVINTEGVFYTDIHEQLGGILPAGNHTLNVYAVDIYGTVGKTTVIPFVSEGTAPSFGDSTVKLKGGAGIPAGELPYELSMEIHPESNASVLGSVTSDCGLTSVRWLFNGAEAGSTAFKNSKGTSKFEIPLSQAPWGTVHIQVIATDIYERETQYDMFLYQTDLTTTRADEAVVFSDSGIAEDGTVNLTKGESVSGYVTGGVPSSVALDPDEGFVTAQIKGSSIVLTATGKSGVSSRTTVKVTTQKGLEYTSKALVFKVPDAVPQIRLRTDGVQDGFKDVKVTGSVTGASDMSLVSAEYRVLTAAQEELPSWKKLTVDEAGAFELSLKAASFEEGISIVEIKAVNGTSDSTAAAVAVAKVSPLPEPDPADPKAKAPVAAAPSIAWIEGEQLYYTCYYQDELTFTSLNVAGRIIENGTDGVMAYAQAGAVPYSLLPAGASTVEVKVTDVKAKAASSKKAMTRDTAVSVRLDSIDGTSYLSGMPVVLPAYGAKVQDSTMRVVVNSGLAVTGLSYTITAGESTAASGKATVKRISTPDGIQTNDYEAYIPLKNLTAELNTISVVAEVGKTQTAEASGTISVLREAPEAGIANEEKVYWFKNVPEYQKAYLLREGAQLGGYVNVKAPFQAEFAEPVEGLSLKKSGSFVYITAVQDGRYDNVVIRITDKEGIVYEQAAVSVIGDSAAPALAFVTPDEQSWLQNTLPLSVRATDGNGITAVEYSLNNDGRWIKLEPTEENPDVYKADVSMSACEEGLVAVDVRTTDAAGSTSIIRRSVFKDITPPQVETIVPAAGDIINGETLISMKVTDNGKLVSGFYSLVKEKVTESAVAQAAAPGETEAESEEGEAEGEADAEAAEPATVKVTETVSFEQQLQFTPFVSTMVGTSSQPLDDEMTFVFTDASGNVQTYTRKDFSIDSESDKPVVSIQLPPENSVQTTAFTISGTVLDDDGESSVWYKMDDGDFQKLPETGTSWAITIPAGALTDNEHTITVYAVDQFGIVGDQVTRTICISNAEPEGEVLAPNFETTVKGRVTINGTSFDENGIDKVTISLDNGTTWDNAEGTTEWSYEFDTRVVEDGTHVVFIRIWDNYGIQSLYSSLINIDNTAPEISLELPRDNSTVKTGSLKLSGQTTDNISLESLYVTIRSLDEDGQEIPEEVAKRNLTAGNVISEDLDVSALPDGLYNLELSGEDKAGNTTRIARNFIINSDGNIVELSLLYPMNGDTLHGNFNIYGQVTGEDEVRHVSLMVDDREMAIADVSETNYVRFPLTPEMIADGTHTCYIRTTLNNGEIIKSVAQSFTYEAAGPWVTIDSISMGDYAIDRPYMSGMAGYMLSAEEKAILENPETTRAEKNRINSRKVSAVELSFDNGKTYQTISSKDSWSYRIENSEMVEGVHYVIVRATMSTGETVATRCIFQIDKTSPVIKLFSPSDSGRYNDVLEFSGIATDDSTLKSVTLALRSGDKSAYEVPSFIQGMYFDAHFLGVTTYDVGIGFTFFDENVKLQAQFGQMSQEMFNLRSQLKGQEPKEMRYGGNVFGLKLLANLGKVPFNYFFGPSFSWLSATFAIGANFSMFSQTQSGRSQILSALIGQIEFPKATFEKSTVISSVSTYFEYQVWSLPSDVQFSAGDQVKSIIPQWSAGVRVTLF